MRACLLTVLHAGSARYFDAFLAALDAQTDLDFELLILNDAASWPESTAATAQRRMAELPFRWRWVDVAGSIVEIRKRGLSILREQRPADAVIFIDSDDLMAPNRVEICKANLKPKEVLVNELILFGEEQVPCALLKHRFVDRQELQLADVTHSNCLGLSNTALLVEDVTRRFQEIPDDTIAFDWAFYTGLLHDGCQARFISGTSTWYRQHADNSASLIDMDDARILRSVLVKAQHYRYVAGFDTGFSKLETGFHQLQSKLAEDGAFRRAFCAHMRATTPAFPQWWENARIWMDCDEDRIEANSQFR
jgi:hypothetical protein